MKALLRLLLLLVAFVVVGSVLFDKDKEPAPQQAAAVTPAKKTPEEMKRDLLWTRDVLMLRALKESMKNPASFQLSSAIRMKDETLCVSYRATNSFNAIVPGQAVLSAKVAVTSDQKGFAGHWNRLCANKRGEDLSFIRRAL